MFSTPVEQEILKYAIEHWNTNFTGVSAISVSDNLDCTHEDVLAVFDKLEQIGKGNLRRNVKLYRISIALDKPQFSEEEKEIVTSIFFPSKELLTNNFYQNDLNRRQLPEYLIRLHKGGSQIELCYFSFEVLKKYFDHQEKFNIEDTVSGGYLSLSNDYINQFSEDELEKDLFVQVRYGKRRLQNGEFVISAILHDLSELPASEQRHWHSCEIEDPVFAKDDSDFERFFRRDFLAEWIDYNDPLEKTLEQLTRVNSLLFLKLFTKEQNTYLSYPILNTYKNFCDCCSELYKLIGPDSLNGKWLKKLLEDYFGYSQEKFIHEESGRPLSQVQLLKLVAKHIEEAEPILDIIETVKEHRVAADHKIIVPKYSQTNYVFEFRQICDELNGSLARFADRIEVMAKK